MSEQIRADFFCVSLPNNIGTLKQSVPVINEFYDYPVISIVCPDHSVNEFIHELGHHKNIKFIQESELISSKEFQSLVEKYAASLMISANEIERVNWYYQQALKTSFALQYAQSEQSIVMLDADTILLNKIEFFSNGRSKLYGSMSEYNAPYFQTLETVLSQLPNHFLAFTVQFFSCTASEAKYLEGLLKNYHPKDEKLSYSEWISTIIIKSVMSRHHAFKPALFSEQELFGLSNKIYAGGKQEKILHLRFGLNGPLDSTQMKFIKRLGFRHLTYEPVQQFINKRQAWISLIMHAFRELYRQRSGKIIRKAKRRIALLEAR